MKAHRLDPDPSTELSTPTANALPTIAANDQPGADPLGAKKDDGSPYAGNLLDDVLAYRDLRAKKLRSELAAAQQSLLENLEERLRGGAVTQQSGVVRLRAFHRYHCDFPASIKNEETGASISVRVLDLSAGGAKVEGSNDYSLGQAVSVVFSTAREPICLPARVAWAKGECFGIMFAGAARSL